MIKMTMVMRDAHDHFLEWQCESARRLFANPQPHITTDSWAAHDIPNPRYGTARAHAPGATATAADGSTAPARLTPATAPRAATQAPASRNANPCDRRAPRQAPTQAPPDTNQAPHLPRWRRHLADQRLHMAPAATTGAPHAAQQCRRTAAHYGVRPRQRAQTIRSPRHFQHDDR